MNHGGLGLQRTYGSAEIPVWQGLTKDIQLAQGGFLLDQTNIAVGQIIPAGTPLVFDEVARTAVVLSTAVAQANANGTATDYPVLKGHGFRVGDYLASGATGGKAYAITAIDTTTYSDKDIITVGTTIGAVTAGSLLFKSTATGATASALPNINGCLYAEAVGQFGGISVSAVIRGTAYAKRVPYSAAIAAKLDANGAYIIYSQSL